MCGIAGFIAEDIRPVPDATIRDMRARILYRGRDAQGEWNDGQYVHLLHSRLSIIDLNRGQQPMWDLSGRYVIVYNGEIYNYLELRKDYERQGATFQTQSDTEVILEGFKLKGEKICSELNGIFALALWDTKEKCLFLARDHLGKKPLYWCTLNGVFYFASTLDAFGSIPGWSNKLSLAALGQYMSIGGFPEDATIYENAYAVPNASFGFVKPGQAKFYHRRYWQMDFSTKSSQSFPELLDEYENLLTDAIAIRLRSDVPLAHTFSGGVDSGTIAAIATQKLKVPLKCFTVDYHTPEDPSDETIIAEKMARQFGLEWQYVHFNYHHDLIGDLPEAYRYYDQPSVQLPLVYSYRLYKAIKPYATVVMSGNGADELFTGYIGDEKLRQKDIILNSLRWFRPFASLLQSASSRYRILEKNRWLQKAANLGLPVPNMAMNSMVRMAEQIYPSVAEAIWQAGQRIAAEALQSGATSVLDFKMFMGLTCAVSDSLYRIPDISGLAAQVEVRCPYLDYRMVEYAARLPHRYKVGQLLSPTRNKYLPKIYYARWSPPEVTWAVKKGMGWNIRFDKSIINDTAYLNAFEDAYQTIEKAGLDAILFRNAWINYRKSTSGFNPNAGLTVMGFMLGKWLLRCHINDHRINNLTHKSIKTR